MMNINKINVEAEVNVYIDESGSFSKSDKKDSWSVVAALMVPDYEDIKLRKILEAWKCDTSGDTRLEEESKQGEPDSYKRLLKKLADCKVVILGVAINRKINTESEIQDDQKWLCDQLTRCLDDLDENKDEIERVIKKIDELPPQLYIQMRSGVELTGRTIDYGIRYYEDIQSTSFKKLDWIIDEKNKKKPTFEYLSKLIIHLLVQHCNGSNPIRVIKERDRSIDEILYKHWTFIDSKTNHGIQIVDILAGLIRKVLRGEIKDEAILTLLGKLFIKDEKGMAPILFLHMKNKGDYISNDLNNSLMFLTKHNKKIHDPRLVAL